MSLFWSNSSTDIVVGNYFGRQWAYDIASKAYMYDDKSWAVYLYVMAGGRVGLAQHRWACGAVESVVLVYAVNDRASFDSINQIYIPILQMLTPQRPLFLVGMKRDTREMAESGGIDPGPPGSFVSTEEGMLLASQINAVTFTELTTDDLKELDDFWTRTIDETFKGPNYKKIRAHIRSATNSCILL